MTGWLAVGGVLAENNFGDTRSDDGLAGPLSLLIILLLAAATVLLIRNMNARLRRLPERFPNYHGTEDTPRDTPTEVDTRGGVQDASTDRKE